MVKLVYTRALGARTFGCGSSSLPVGTQIEKFTKKAYNKRSEHFFFCTIVFMGYRQVNSLLIIASVFVLLAGVAFLLHRQDFFAVHENNNTPTVTSNTAEGSPRTVVRQVVIDALPALPAALSIEEQNTKKVLKSFGFCGDPSKNEMILSYPVELLNALLEDVQGSHCEIPKEGYPNYTFLLPDTSLIRLAEMTPDHKYIFYLKVETSSVSSTYYLHKIDIAQKQNFVLEKITVSNDWPLQKDFYEEDLLPRQIQNGKYLTYNWFIKDPKGESNPNNFLRGKILDPLSNKVIFVDPSRSFDRVNFLPAVSENAKNLLFRCGLELCITNFLQVKKINFPESTKSAPLGYEYFRFKDNLTVEVGFGGSPVFIPVPGF